MTRDIQSIAAAIAAHPASRWLRIFLQSAFLLGVCIFLVKEVQAIGWDKVTQSLPTTPWFYVFFLAMYFAFPIAEWFVYRLLWGDVVRRRFDVFIKMRIYNYAVMSYSGEAYLALWGSKNLQQSKRKTAAEVKDSNILSALSSNSLTLALIMLFFSTGQLKLITDSDPAYSQYIAIAAGLGLVLIPLVVMFRGKIFSISADIARRVFATHLSRLITVVGLQVAQWAVVLPLVPLDTWLLFLTAQFILTRIPFLPNADLLFAGVGLALLGYVDAPTEVLAGIFVASGALSQCLNLVLFLSVSLFDLSPRKNAGTLKE